MENKKNIRYKTKEKRESIEECLSKYENKINKVLEHIVEDNNTTKEHIKEKTIKELKIQYEENSSLSLYYNLDCIKYQLENIIKILQESKNDFVNCVKNYIGVSLIYDFHNMYGCNIPYGVDDSDNSIDFCDYENCLLYWSNDTEEHIKDLYKLISLESVEDYETCIKNCYFELKVLAFKLDYSISASLELDKDLAWYDCFEENPNIREKLWQLWEITDIKQVKKIYSIYHDIYQRVCMLGNYLFLYANRYENVYERVRGN